MARAGRTEARSRAGPGRAVVGISGWRYAPWRGVFYPRGLAQRRELEHASSRFATIEVNGTFYSLVRPSTFEGWHDETPAGFVFALKGSRYITHLLRLARAEVPLANFFASGVLRLGEKLGPILWQFPERFAFDESRLEAFFRQLPRTHGEAARLARRHDERLAGRSATSCRAPAETPIRHAIEPRHPSFGAPELVALCARHGIAVVMADTAGVFPRFDVDTTEFRYLRLHGGSELYVSGYSSDELDAWATTIRKDLRRGRDVYVYFDNDVQVRAPFDAEELAARLNGSPVHDRPAALAQVTEKARTVWPAWDRARPR